MEIELAKSSGFCFGVKRALNIALETARAKTHVYMLGDIVHNEDVIKEIKKAGIKKIRKLRPGRNKTLLIRAHGAAKKTFAQAHKLGYKIVDATCSMVKETHRIVQSLERHGYRIIVIGDKMHDEVQGIVGQIKGKAIVINRPDHIPTKIIKKVSKAAVVVQSTQNIDQVFKVIEILKKYIKRLKFYNTICRPTKIKQEEIKKMALENEIMIIIGSQTSANTKRLYEISKSLNRRSYWVQRKNQLRPVWFKGVQSAGVAAGASTPDITTQKVIQQILKFNPSNVEEMT